MLLDQRQSPLPLRVSILGKAADVFFVIKKSSLGCHLFVKVAGRWKSVPGMDFHRHVPSGVYAEIRSFEYDPLQECWKERWDRMFLWDPETN